MPTVYLFRIDSSKDNDAFFEALNPTATHVYAGSDFRVGTVDWIPDFVRVILDDTSQRCSLTLIELEATQSEALRSCRKFLPENSTTIVTAFSDYLGRVIRQCQSTADRRANDFKKLKALLSEMKHVSVSTAGALRSSTRFIEELPLIDQPKNNSDETALIPIEETQPIKSREFRGMIRLSANDAKAVARCVMILDAIVRGRDHSEAVFRTWRGQNRSQPLKYLLIHTPGKYPVIRSFIFEKGNSGLVLDFEGTINEIAELWSAARKRTIGRERIRALIASYYPIASEVTANDRMTAVFELARAHLVGGFGEFLSESDRPPGMLGVTADQLGK
jgi:hypothetical protein